MLFVPVASNGIHAIKYIPILTQAVVLEGNLFFWIFRIRNCKTF